MHRPTPGLWEFFGFIFAHQNNYKESKWAKNIIAMQESDGKWGCFHSLSQFYHSPITTEQALRRLERLGYTIEMGYGENCK